MPYQPGIPLIILVPGYLYLPKLMMKPMAKRFTKAGFQCDLLSDAVFERRIYEQQLQGIITYLANHKHELEKVPTVVFIGHAVGGLHAFEAASWLVGTPWYKGQVIALPLAAPFRKRGSYLQDIFLQMSLVRRGATALLQPSRDRQYWPDQRLKMLCIAGSRDELVDVDRAMMYRAQATLVVDADHQTIIYSKDVFGVLLRTIRSFMNEAPSEPTTTE